MFDTVELHEFLTYFWYLPFMNGWFENIISQYVSQSAQSLSCVWLFVTLWTAAPQASLSITNSQSFLRLMSIGLVMPSNYLILCRTFSSHLQSFLASGSFQMSQFFSSGGHSFAVSASASVFPVNIQDWFPLGWTGWISLQSKILSRVFSNTTVQNHQFFDTQLQGNANENHTKLSPDSCWRDFPGDSDSMELARSVGDPSSIPGLERILEKGMATHYSILAWRNPWTEEPDGLQSMGSQSRTQLSN